MDISKFSKAEVLATLYNRAKPQGLGLLQFDPKPMTIREAEILLAESANHYFDYVKGRVLKVNLAENKLNTFLYNRDNGHEAAEKALSSLR